jgi:hypothetical protein
MPTVEEWWESWAVQVDVKLNYLNEGFMKHEAYTQGIQGLETQFKEHIDISTRASLSDFQEAMRVEFQHQIERMDQMQGKVMENIGNAQRKVENEMLEFAQKVTGQFVAGSDQLGIIAEAQKKSLTHEVSTAYGKLCAQVDERLTAKTLEAENLIQRAENILQQTEQAQHAQNERLQAIEDYLSNNPVPILDMSQISRLENKYIQLKEEIALLRITIQSTPANSSNNDVTVHQCSQISQKLSENFSRLFSDFLNLSKKVDILGTNTQLSLNNAQSVVQTLQHDLKSQEALVHQRFQVQGQETAKVKARVEQVIQNPLQNPHWQSLTPEQPIVVEKAPSASLRQSKHKSRNSKSSSDSDSDGCAFRLVPPKPTKESATGLPNIGLVHQLNVRPVGLSQTLNGQMPMYMHPLQQEVLKTLVKPKFTGYPLDWAQFAKDWDKYLKRMSCNAILSDGDQMALLEGCLDPESQLWLQSLKDSETGISFQEFYAQMEDRYGRHRDKGTRKRWQDVSLPDSGKITTHEWDGFTVRFKMAQREVPDATEDEAYRLLSSKLPPYFLQMIAEKEAKLNEKNPVILVSGIPNLSAHTMKKTIKKLAGKAPIDVELKGNGNYLCKFDDEEIAEKVIRMHNTPIENEDCNFQCKRIARTCRVSEIFDAIRKKLRIQEDTSLRAQLTERGRTRTRVRHLPQPEKSTSPGRDRSSSRSSGGRSRSRSSRRNRYRSRSRSNSPRSPGRRNTPPPQNSARGKRDFSADTSVGNIPQKFFNPKFQAKPLPQPRPRERQRQGKG